MILLNKLYEIAIIQLVFTLKYRKPIMKRVIKIS